MRDLWQKAMKKKGKEKMITVDMYEIGEQVLIKASIIDIAVEQGKLKYKLRVEHTNDELEHTFTDNQIIPILKTKNNEIIPVGYPEEDLEMLKKFGIDPNKFVKDIKEIDKELGSKVASGELYPGEFEQRSES